MTKPPRDVLLSLRLPPELRDLIDAQSEEIQKQNPDMRITRSDVIRILLKRALRAPASQQGDLQ